MIRVAGRIIINEWKSFCSDRTAFLLILILVSCSVYGLYNGTVWASRHEQVWIEANWKAAHVVAEWKEKLKSGGGAKSPFNNLPEASDPYFVSTQLQDVVMPPAPFAAISVGQSDLYPVHTTVRAWSGEDSLFSKSELGNPSNLLTGRFDLAFVIVYLYPLMILGISYGLLSAEKEEGTLPLLLSQPVSISSVLASKILFRLLVTTLPIVITTMVFLRRGLVIFSAAVAMYGIVWLCLAAAVNLSDKGSAAHAMILSGCWLSFVIVVPSLINSVSALLYPIPPRGQIIIAYLDAEPDTRRDGPSALAAYYEKQPDMRPKKETPEIVEFRRQLLAVSLANNKIVAPVVDHYEDQKRGQRKIVSILKFLSPAAVMQEMLNDLAGTGFQRHQHFRDHVKQFIQSQADFFFPKIFRSEKLTLEDYDSMPVYRYEEEPIARLRSRVTAGFVALATFTLLICVIGFYRLRCFTLL
jgi:ABC-2 type transport system permease protein